MSVEGNALKAGTYALYTLPNEHEWEVYFYKNANQSGLPRAWDDNEVAAKFMVKPRQAGDFVETFTIGIGMVAADAAQIQLAWENTVVPISISVPTDGAVMKSIEKTMAGPSASDYYAAGRYLYESGKDKNKALEYIQKANATDARFWTVRMEALVLADLGRIKAPCLVIGGQNDIFTPRWMSEELAAAIPNAELHLFPDAGHAFHWECLDGFNERSTAFLRKHSGS